MVEKKVMIVGFSLNYQEHQSQQSQQNFLFLNLETTFITLQIYFWLSYLEKGCTFFASQWINIWLQVLL